MVRLKQEQPDNDSMTLKPRLRERVIPIHELEKRWDRPNMFRQDSEPHLPQPLLSRHNRVDIRVADGMGDATSPYFEGAGMTRPPLRCRWKSLQSPTLRQNGLQGFSVNPETP